MADFQFNRSKGRLAEWAERVNASDPTNAVFIVAAYNTAATDATLKDLDTVADIESDANTAEVTNTNYSRKSIDQSGGLTITYDDTNDRVDVDMPDQTWTSIAAGTAWTDLLIAYDSDSAAGTDANILPGAWYDFAVTPVGSDITAVFNSAGFYRAS